MSVLVPPLFCFGSDFGSDEGFISKIKSSYTNECRSNSSARFGIRFADVMAVMSLIQEDV